jgi:hypothetical protein
MEIKNNGVWRFPQGVTWVWLNLVQLGEYTLQNGHKHGAQSFTMDLELLWWIGLNLCPHYNYLEGW